MIHVVQANFIIHQQQWRINVLWENIMPSINRRRLLKAISAAGAAAAVPVSVNAAAKMKTGRHTAVYIDTRHKDYSGTSTREIVNQSDQPLVLNGYQPVTVRNSGGDITTLHLNTPNTLYTLQPGERLPVYAQAVMTTPPSASDFQGSLSAKTITIV